VALRQRHGTSVGSFSAFGRTRFDYERVTRVVEYRNKNSKNKSDNWVAQLPGRVVNHPTRVFFISKTTPSVAAAEAKLSE